MLIEPRGQTCGDAGRLGHAANACRQAHRPLALADRELSEEKEGGARLGRNPVWIAPSGIQISDLRGLGRPRGNLRKVVLDLERTQGLVLTQRDGIHISPVHLLVNSTIAMPKIVSSVLPMAYGIP